MRHDDNLHQGLRRRKGSAKNFKCVAASCDRRGYDWAYQHTGTPEDPESYAPMCRSHHRKLDYARGNFRPSGRKLSSQEARDMQAKAARRLKHFTSDGRPAVDVARENGVKPVTYRARIRRGVSVEEAVLR